MPPTRSLLVVVLCAAAASAATDPSPPALRLPEDVRPLRYDLELTLDPRREDFSGVVRADLELAKPTRFVWLHGTDLRISRATLQAGAETVTARVVAAPPDFIGLALPRSLGPGPARLEIAYDGKLDSVRSQGLYRVQEPDGAWYVYSFFEPLDARRAFPCFDEPAFKVPWRLTFHVPPGHVALANAPVASEKPGENGNTIIIAESKPMPSYLVALVVGPFEVVRAGTAGDHGTVLRFIIPRGRSGELGYARAVTSRFISLLEGYFGMPYPYEKLDVAVVPRFWGTMEHPGIVALGQPLTLIAERDRTPQRERRYANIAIHELAHYWFGDYVTMRWWDDTWLNEALATWLDQKLTQRFEPAWKYEVATVAVRHFGMDGDSLAAAQPIRHPIASRSDIQDSFDARITYFKGSAVLAMFETWLGEERFQQVIRRHMAEHAWKTATAEDLLRTFDATTGQDVAGAVRTFLDQPGVPLVRLSLDCPAGGSPRLALSQERFLASGAPSGDARWRVPVCARWGAGRASGRSCALLVDKQGQLALDGAPRCPDWVIAKPGGQGYYRAAYSPELRQRLERHLGAMSAAERVAYVSDVRALVGAGGVPILDSLALVPALAAGDEHSVWEALELVHQIRFLDLSDELDGRARRMLQRLFGPRARALGWTPRRGETLAARELREELVPFLAEWGRDRALGAQARRLASAWLADRSAVADDIVVGVLSAAAGAGDRTLFDQLLAAAHQTKDRRDRSRLLAALGAFRDPALADQALALVRAPDIDLRDSRGILWSGFLHRETRQRAYDFVKRNFDSLRGRLRDDEARGLLDVANEFCDAEHRADAAAFFPPRAKGIDGGEQRIATVLEEIDVCVAARARNAPGVQAFLRRY